jgi:ATP-binding cassette subfamily F protein 3
MAQNLIQIQNGAKGFGGQKLFTGATFAINADEHVGVIGPNGAGKTTLFKILTDQEHLDEGQIIRAKNLSVGYLSQHDNWHAEETGNQYLERLSRFPMWEVKSRGRGLQVTEEIFAKPIVSLSGGYRMRIKLIGLLGQNPNLMLLDEPTNYLDLETTLLLEKFLQTYDGAFLLISHDREFLRRTTDHILEVEAGEITKFNGDIDDYFEQKELLRSQLAAAARSQAEKRKTVLEFVARFGAKATKAKQAQSRLRALDRMEKIELKSLPVGATIRIPPPAHVGKSVIKITKAEFGYGDRAVLRDVDMDIQRGDHVAVVGLNGAGKSTLLKGIAGMLEPRKGQRELGYQVSVAIFNQHVAEVLNHDHSVLESLEQGAHPTVSRQDILDMAGSLLFSGDGMRKKIAVLSGGERSRVALGRILLQKAPCLLLDEPTNHLDFQTVEALTNALARYEGTFVAVSHDRGFIRRVSSKILEVSNGRVLVYPGTYDEYVWSLQKRLAEDDAVDTPLHQTATKAEPDPHADRREREKKIRSLEREIAKVETELHKHEEEAKALNDRIQTSPPDLTDLLGKMAINASKLQEVESRWIALSEDLQTLKGT